MNKWILTAMMFLSLSRLADAVVIGPGGPDITITAQPASATVTAPAKAVFSVAAAGTSLTYQWMQSADGVTFTGITGATKVSYTTPATTAADNGIQYECVVSNSTGSVTSNAAALTVNVKPAITTQPSAATVTAPDSATFTVAASGLPAPNYQWQQETPGTTTYAAISGATNASYTTPATATGDNGTKFECVVSNAAGSVTSTAVKLTVDTVPGITTQPLSATVTSPAAAKFIVAATGTTPLKYQWMQSADGVTFAAIAGATGALYSTGATTVSESGIQYECVVSNVAGNVTSNAATLTVNAKPSITAQPAATTVTAPAAATFTVIAAGTPAPSYQWQEEPAGATSYTTIAGATNASYTTPATAASDSGTRYECVLSNVAGTVTSAAAKLTVDIIPSITVQPVDVIVTAPAKAIFSVTAAGTAPLSYQWMQSADGVTFTNIPGATKASYTTPATTTAGNGTQFECVVSNAEGSAISHPAILTINPAGFPKITIQPVNVTVTAPSGATFTVKATGSPAPGYQWMQALPGPGTTIFAAIAGATSASYTTPATTTANNGTQFACVVSNSAGSVTSVAAALDVNPSSPPTVSITIPADNSSFAPGSSIAITASAGETNGVISSVSFYNGTALLGTSTTSPYTYNWVNVPSGSYTLTATAVDISGVSTTSTPVTVTVNASPVVSITSPADSSTVAAGSNLTITADAGETGGTISSVAFYNGATLLGTSTASPYTYTVTNAQAGTYTLTAVATDANGVSITSAPVTVTAKIEPIVSITSPVSNSPLTAGSNLTITAGAGETNGVISSVAFYNGTVLLGTSTSPPYSYTLKSVPVGNYTLTAVATDANGVAVTSVPVTITAAGSPQVVIISPISQVTLTTASLDLTATASENFGSITSVAFYNGSGLLGSVQSPSSVFTYSWTNIPAGTYNVTAIATDVIGETVTSQPVTVTINAATFSLVVDDNVAGKTDALGNTTSFQYDNLNRLLQTTFADGSKVSYAYDLFGDQTSVTDQRGNALTKTYDPYERLMATRDPLGDVTQFSYDTNGNLLALTDANNNATTYTYDANNRVLTQTNALNYSTVFTYDPVGNVASRMDANSKITNYTYDADNRLTKTNYPDGTSVSNVLNAIGLKTSMTDATGTTTYTYDSENRPLSKKGSNDYGQAISYTYDGEGNRLSIIDQNNRTITNTYDALNRLSTVTAPDNITKYGTPLTTTYSYDANSNVFSVAKPNGVTESYTYDNLNRVLTSVNTSGSTVISSFSNTYDIAGMITKKTYQDGSWTAYSYDAINRLLEETKQSSSSMTYDYVYAYDPVGNRLSWTKNTTLGGFWTTDYLNMPSQVLTNMANSGYGNTANGAQALMLTRSYVYDAANRLSGWSYGANVNNLNFPIQTDSYMYDNNGNRLAKQAILTGQESTPEQTSYAYDFENRLDQLQYTNIPNVTGTDSLTYNGDGLRTASNLNGTTTNYLYEGSNVLMESNSSGITKAYNRGLDVGGGIGSLIDQNYPSGSNIISQYYQYDNLGSVSNLMSSSGASIESYSYDAFGNQLVPQTSNDTNRYLFSSKEFDSRGGLEYFGGRYYDPEIGRWLTSDPTGFSDGINLYAYVHDNPIDLVDHDGNASWQVITGAAIIGAVYGGLEAGLHHQNVWVGIGSGAAAGALAGAGLEGAAGYVIAGASAAGGDLTSQIANNVINQVQGQPTQSINYVSPLISASFAVGGQAIGEAALATEMESESTSLYETIIGGIAGGTGEGLFRGLSLGVGAAWADEMPQSASGISQTQNCSERI